MTSSEERELLLRRAARLAAPRPTDGDADTAVVPVAQFPVGETIYALPVTELCAALPLRDVTPVPLAPAHVIGILRWEGRVITAISLASLLGIRGWRRDPAVLLVVACGGRLVAVDSEVIPTFAMLPQAALEGDQARRKGPVTEVVSAGGQIVYLLDLGRALTKGGPS